MRVTSGGLMTMYRCSLYRRLLLLVCLIGCVLGKDTDETDDDNDYDNDYFTGLVRNTTEK